MLVKIFFSGGGGGAKLCSPREDDLSINLVLGYFGPHVRNRSANTDINIEY